MTKKTFEGKAPRLLDWLWQKDFILLCLLVSLAFVLRLKGISSTPTDWHGFRQSDTASVTREYVKHGVDVLHPHYQDLSNIQSGFDNLSGYRMVEFPFINAGEAVVLRAFPNLDLVTFSRLVSAVFSLGTLIGIYFIGKKWSNRMVGFLSAFAFAIMPYAVYYSRAILPESPFIFFTVWSILGFQYWLDQKKWGWFICSVATFAMAMLLKPFILFLAPLYAVLSIRAFKFKLWQKWQLIVFVIAGILPFIFWRKWILQFPSGIPVSDWLFNSNHIRFRPAWFRWLFLERLTKLMLGWFGLPIFLAGAFFVKSKKWINYAAWGVGALIYLSVIATGNVQHDYYQVFLIPIVCLFVGLGMNNLANLTLGKLDKAPRELKIGLVLAVLLASTFTANILYIRGYYRTRPDWEVAGQAADRLLPADAKVIAPAFGDTSFLFQTNRTGWPIGFDIDQKIKFGAQYYVTTSYDDEARQLEQKYVTIAKTPDYLILNLQVLKGGN